MARELVCQHECIYFEQHEPVPFEQHFWSEAQPQGLLQEVSLEAPTYQEHEQLPVEQPHFEAHLQALVSVLGQGQAMMMNRKVLLVVCRVLPLVPIYMLLGPARSYGEAKNASC